MTVDEQTSDTARYESLLPVLGKSASRSVELRETGGAFFLTIGPVGGPEEENLTLQIDAEEARKVRDTLDRGLAD